MFRDVNHWNRCLVRGISSAPGRMRRRRHSHFAARRSINERQPRLAHPGAAEFLSTLQAESSAQKRTRVPRNDMGSRPIEVRAVESGELIRFSYHVVNPAKAKPLNDKKTDAFLISPVARVKLVIPSLEKVGQLRQTETPEAGKSYWMAFSNPRRKVKPGDRVNVDIGQFHVAGLVVE